MEVLSCPKCGAPVPWGATNCQYCNASFAPAGFEPSPASRPAAPSAPQTPPPQPEPQIPTDWVRYKNAFLGFSLAHPPGWEVLAMRGRIRIQEDSTAQVSALIWPFRIPQPQPALQLGAYFIAQARQTDPGLQAWQSAGAGGGTGGCILRTATQRFGRPVEGRYGILVNGTDVIVSGFDCPQDLLGARAPVMAQLISTFRMVPPMPQHTVQEPSEGAFSLRIPADWIFQGGVNRNNIGGKGMPGFTVMRDPQGLVCAAQPPSVWTYMEGGMGFFGGLTGTPSLSFLRAADYCTRQVAPWFSQSQQNFQVEAVQDRPDLAYLFAIENAKASGMPIQQMEATVACLTTGYVEGAVRLRQKSRVFTFRQVNPGQGWFGGGGSPTWIAGIASYYRAPGAEFASWEPVLEGVIDSYQTNPAWAQSENRLVQNYLMNSAQDRSRRLQQISQTLSETSDIISQGYWDRQAVYDRLSHDRSNAILGYQDMADPSGNTYSIPTGYDRYWIDGLGNVFGGDWMTKPDIHWQPLEGI